MVEFYLYDEHKEMSLYDFCWKVSDARITSIHFPVLRYFTIFASRCLIGCGNCGNLSVPDIIILFHGLFCDNSVSMGGIIAND